MANLKARRTQNVAGDWFVDETCIDCGTCMWMDPSHFQRVEGKSAVTSQPPGQDGEASAALLACPTGSIGGPAAKVEFPRKIAPGVWHCGYHDRSSFGAASYLVETDGGLVMIDSPRFVKPLANAIEEMGGLVAMAFTHRDDVADHKKWAAHFDVPRYIHQHDDVIGDQILSGPVAGLEWVPVPGHTRGHVVFRHGSSILTGDHLAGATSPKTGLRAFRGACWYDWREQTASMQTMADWDVKNILPGHGAPWHGSVDEYQDAMANLLVWMRQVA